MISFKGSKIRFDDYFEQLKLLHAIYTSPGEIFSSLIVAGNLSRSSLNVMDIENNNQGEGDHEIKIDEIFGMRLQYRYLCQNENCPH